MHKWTQRERHQVEKFKREFDSYCITGSPEYGWSLVRWPPLTAAQLDPSKPITATEPIKRWFSQDKRELEDLRILKAIQEVK
jgi:hypothetical protein